MAPHKPHAGAESSFNICKMRAAGSPCNRTTPQPNFYSGHEVICAGDLDADALVLAVQRHITDGQQP